MKERPVVSAVVTTHDRFNLLQGALASVYAQEELGTQFDVEVIVVDDASSDATPEIGRLYPHIQYIRFETNRGASASRNAGIRASRGKYVAFLDDDDLWLPHRLRVQVPILERQPEIGVVYGHGVVSDEYGNIVTWPEEGPSGHVFEEFVTKTDNFINLDTVLVRREAFEKAGYYDEGLPTMEHYEMALRLARHYRWRFVKGQVSYGRYSQQGKYSRNVASGDNERVLPVIIEKALAMLPQSSESEQIRQKARVAVCATIADQRWGTQGAEAVRAHLLMALQTYPWMVDIPRVMEHLCRVERELACRSASPISTVRRFLAELEPTLEQAGSNAWRRRRLAAECLLEVAKGFQKNGSPRRALGLAWYTLLRHPTQVRKRIVWDFLLSTVRQIMATREPAPSREDCVICAEKPLVSVIIPTSNRARLLRGAIKSVYEQEGAGELFDMEVIVVDDASSDDTADAIRQFPEVKYIPSTTNKGVSATRNIGISASKGKYIAFLDDDDQWLPHKLRVQVPVLEMHPEISVVYGQGLAVDEAGNSLAWPARGPSGHVFQSFLTTVDDLINIDTLLVRREAMERAGLFDESLHTMEHCDLALRLAFHCQWHFIEGPTVLGRILRQGIWIIHMLNGENARMYRHVIEKALALLPETREYEIHRVNARAAACAFMANQYWFYGSTPKVQAYLLESLSRDPPIVHVPSVVKHLASVARELGVSSSTPVTTVRAYWKAVRAAAGARGIRARMRMRGLLGDFITEVAIGLKDQGSPRLGGLVAACAVLHAPTQLRRRTIWRCFYDALKTHSKNRI